MNKIPLVSIVTPSFNQSQYLEKTIQSVLNQDYPNLEYIIIDGGSTDGSVEIIKKYESEITHWVSEPDQGQTDAINKGFKLAKGEILAWLNSDDIYYPNAVQDVVKFLSDNLQVGMVYGDCDLIDGTGQVIGQFDARQTNHQRLMRGHGNIPQPAAFWQADLWDRVGPLDPTFQFAMDFDLWVRLSQVTELQYNPGLLAGFRIHDQAKTNTNFSNCWPEMRRVHRREGGGLISIFMGRYLFRRLFSPTWNKVKRLSQSRGLP